MKYEIIGGKIFATERRELTPEEIVNLLDAIPKPREMKQKLSGFEPKNLGKPKSKQVTIFELGQEAPDTVAAAWKVGKSDWLYNFFGAQTEANHRKKRLPTILELETNQIRENIGYAGYVSNGLSFERGALVYFWSGDALVEWAKCVFKVNWSDVMRSGSDRLSQGFSVRLFND